MGCTAVRCGWRWRRRSPRHESGLARSSPRLESFKDAIDGMLRADLGAPRKQRHTATRVLARLVEEYDAKGLSYSTVRDYVRVRRAQIDLEGGRRVEAFIAQEHAPGEEAAEVDFGEVWVVLGGVKTKCYMFVLWLSHSGKAIHRIFLRTSHRRVPVAFAGIVARKSTIVGRSCGDPCDHQWRYRECSGGYGSMGRTESAREMCRVSGGRLRRVRVWGMESHT